MERSSLRNYLLSALFATGCTTFLIKDTPTESLEEVIDIKNLESVMDKNYFSATEYQGKLERSFLNHSLVSGSTIISSEYNFDKDPFPEVIAYFPVNNSRGKVKVTYDFAKLILVDHDGDNKYDFVREATNKKGIFDFEWKYEDWLDFQENSKTNPETRII